MKVRQALPATSRLTDTKDVAAIEGNVQCEPPNRLLYEFSGVLRMIGQQ